MTDRTYFDAKCFTNELPSRFEHTKLLAEKAITMPRTEFVQWLTDNFGEVDMPGCKDCTIAEYAMMAYEESLFNKEDILYAMQEQIDDVVKAQNKAKAEILRLKALIA